MEGLQPCAESSPRATLRLAAADWRGTAFLSHPQFPAPAEASGPLIHWCLINNTMSLKGFRISEALVFKKDALHLLSDWEEQMAVL